MSRFHARIPWRDWALFRRAILQRDGYRCRSCGQAGRLEVDHVTPLNMGGAPLAGSNAQTLCRSCHIDKTTAANTDPQRLAFRRYARSL